MRSRFPGYYRLTSHEFEALWKDCLFALDANVLLNLYRYPATARAELISIFLKDPSRYWIPYQAALEFQRNRLKVIADQKKRFSEVSQVLEKTKTTLFAGLEALQLKTRHSSINADSLIETMSKAVADYMEDLSKLEAVQAGVLDDDPLRTKIDEIFGARIGDPPATQDELDAAYKEGKGRFDNGIPPGFRDVDKAKSELDIYVNNGLLYQAQFGDFLLWRQILGHAKSNNLKSLILVTDDKKSDWWSTIEAQGTKTLGPRPELVEEANAAGIVRFYIYNSEQFLKYAKQYLAAQVSEESIKQVGDIARLARAPAFSPPRVLRAKRALKGWLLEEFEAERLESRQSFPTLLIKKEGEIIGSQMITFQSPGSLAVKLDARLRELLATDALKNFDRIFFIATMLEPDERYLKQAADLIRQTRKLPPGLEVLLGWIEEDETARSGSKFCLKERFVGGEKNLL